MAHESANDVERGRGGFLWLELTNGCNLQCGHCYSDSSPGSGRRDQLQHEDYVRVITEGASVGISSVQFIGGEPMLYKKLPNLLEYAQLMGLSVEIFSNLTVDRPEVWNAVNPRTTSVATSVYSDAAGVHDRVTRKLGSFRRTVGVVTSLVGRGIRVRAEFIETAQNVGHYEQTASFLAGLGVTSVGYDRVRSFGRGAIDADPSMQELCGRCAGNTLCVTYDGTIAPCIMSRTWPLGNVMTDSVAEIARAVRTTEIRQQIAAATISGANAGTSSTCGPTTGPSPCGPDRGGPCAPTSPCAPRRPAFSHAGPCVPSAGSSPPGPGPCGPERGAPCAPTNACAPRRPALSQAGPCSPSAGSSPPGCGPIAIPCGPKRPD